jgi:WD40 repeat protein
VCHARAELRYASSRRSHQKSPASSQKDAFSPEAHEYEAEAIASAVHPRPEFTITSLFLSYARGDDEAFALRLWEDLTRAGFDVWFDRRSMPARQLTFLQEIRDAIAARDRLVLIVGPGAATSDYVIQEWQFAYRVANKCVNPVVRLDGVDAQGRRVDGYSLIPADLKGLHAEDFRDDSAYAGHLQNLIRQLSENVPPAGPLMGVPELPPHYREQPERLDALRDILLRDLRLPVVVTGAAARLGLSGMGGIGKSVLANAVVRHPEVRRAFRDGVFWISVGQKPRVTELQRWVARQLGDESVISDEQSGTEKLRGLLAGRSALLVLDDVWQRRHAEAFPVAGPLGRILLTTRDESLVTAMAARDTHFQVELPSVVEAEEMLAAATDVDRSTLPAEARAVITECGRLPLALGLVGAMVAGGTPWRDVLDALHEHDLEFLSRDHPAEEHHRNAWKAMDVSLRVLAAADRDRFAELAVFDLGRGIPESAAETLWAHTAGLTPRAARKLLAAFARRSLLQVARGLDERLVTQHDLLHNFAEGMAEKRFGALAALHRMLLDAYRKKCPGGWATGPDDGYFFQSLARHLRGAEDVEVLRALLFDYAWLQARLRATNVSALLGDFADLTDRSAPVVWGVLRLSAHLLAQDPAQLPSQLVGRLRGIEDSEIELLLSEAIASERAPWLCPLTRSLTASGGPLLVTIAAHEFGVNLFVVAQSILSTGSDSTIRSWDPETGAELWTLQETHGTAPDIVFSPDGRYALSAWPVSLRLWDLQRKESFELYRHWRMLWPSAVTFTPDSRCVVVAADFADEYCNRKEIRLWDLETREQKLPLRGHSQSVECLALTADGRLVSGANDDTARVWDLSTGATLFAVRHESSVNDVAVSLDQRWLLTASLDRTIGMWNLDTGTLVRVLRHRHPVETLTLCPDGRRFVSTTREETTLWDLESGTAIRAMESSGQVIWRHPNRSVGVAVSPCSRFLVTPGPGGAVHVQDLESGAVQRLRSHTGHVRGAVFTRNGERLVTGSEDGSLKVWDMTRLESQTAVSGHEEWVRGIAVTPDGREAISAGRDGAVRIWSLDDGREVATLAGHTAAAEAIAISAGGAWAVSAVCSSWMPEMARRSPASILRRSRSRTSGRPSFRDRRSSLRQTSDDGW